MDHEIDFSKIRLSSTDEEALRHIQTKGVIDDAQMNDDPYAYLLRLKLIEHCYSDKFPYYATEGFVSIPLNALRLNDRGKLFLAHQDEQKRAEAKKDRRYWFSNVLSILALIISLIALAAQLGLLQLQWH